MLHSLKTKQLVKSDIDTVWDFISSPKNVQTITPDYMGFIMLSDPAEKMFPGQIIEYKVSPLIGIKLHWVTEITHVQDKEYFVDEQRFGPYAFWHHKHFLKETKEGVVMYDEVHYKAPMGIVGRMANALFIKRQLKQIFDYRFGKIEELFNK